MALIPCWRSWWLVMALIPVSEAAEPYAIHVGSRHHRSPAQALEAIARHRVSHPQQAIDVLVEPGDYLLEEPLVIDASHSGTAQAPIRWLATGNAKPVFSGGIQLHGFTVAPDGTWRCALPSNLTKFHQLWVNDQRATLARHPNQGFLLMKSVTEEPIDDKRSRQKVTMSPTDMQLLQNIAPLDLTSVQMLAYHKWDNTRRGMESLDANTGTLTTIGKPMKPWNRWDQHTGIIFTNFPAALDAPGEWYVDARRILHYRPRPGEVLDKAKVIAPRLSQLLIIKGTQEKRVSDISWRGFRFLHTGWKFPAQGFEPQQAAASIEAVIQADFCDRMTFESCEVAHSGLYGIWFRQQCHSNTVRACKLHDLGAGGLRSGTMELPATTAMTSSHQLFDNNIIQYTGQEFPCAAGVWIGHARDQTVSHNDIGHMPYTGISVGWRWGYERSEAKHNKILQNHIHHIGDGLLSDMGAVYTLGPSEGTIISGNHIHDVKSYKYGGWGLYNDEGSTGIVMENNLVHHTKSGSYHQHYGKENVLRNNILAFASEQQLQFTRAEAHTSFHITHNIILWERGPIHRGHGWKTGKFEASGNLYWRTDAADPGTLPHEKASRWADPMFKDPASGDWTLKAGSPAFSLGFKPWDFRKAGRYGDDIWKKSSQ